MNKANIKHVRFIKSSIQTADCPPPVKHEYAFIGRSNVGKSSLINALTNRKNLAKTSSSPGKTRLINHFLVDDAWYLVDLPGYGFAKRSKTERKAFEQLITEYVTKRENLVCLFVLIDSRIPPQEKDLVFINNLGELQVPFYLVFTKADKLSTAKKTALINDYTDVLKDRWDSLPPHFITSAKSKEGCAEILKEIQRLNGELPVEKFL